MSVEDESGLSSEEVETIRDRYCVAARFLMNVQNSFIGMALDQGIDREVMKTQMLAMTRDFFESMDKHQLDPLVGHAVACTLAIATLEKWKP
jgi:hypothetical protein